MMFLWLMAVRMSLMAVRDGTLFDFSASITGVQVDLSTGTLVDGEGVGDHFTSIRSSRGQR